MQTFEDLWNAFVERCGQEAPTRTREELKTLAFSYAGEDADGEPIYDRIDTAEFWDWIFEDGWAWALNYLAEDG